MAQEIDRDSSGRILGYIEHGRIETVVRDSGQRIVGYADSHGTHDAGRRRLLNTPAPEFLLRR